jgi:enamine deaminase RidA (YjgF/YER057c/UK114 family)
MTMIVTTLAALAADPSGRASMTITMPEETSMRQIHENAGYAEALVAPDGTIYVSGVVGVQRPGEETFDAAFERAFVSIQRHLERVGASWDDVVDMLTFHTDLPAQSASFGRIKARYVRAPFPTWTAIGITRLVPPKGLVEIRVVAKRTAAGVR